MSLTAGAHTQGSLYRPTRGDYVLGVLLLAASCAGFVMLYAPPPPIRANQAVVFLNGQRVGEWALTGREAIQEKVAGGALTLEIADGRVRVLDSQCARKWCQAHGWISQPGETIVCLPSRILVEIQGEKAPDDVDVVGY